MVAQSPLDPNRVRKITGSFAFIEHRFLREGFFSVLTHHELLLYVFLVLVADRDGLSYYSYDKICILLKITLDDYITARDGLIEKDLIAFNGYLFQVLSLPNKVPEDLAPLKNSNDMQNRDPATIHQLIVKSIGYYHD